MDVMKGFGAVLLLVGLSACTTTGDGTEPGAEQPATLQHAVTPSTGDLTVSGPGGMESTHHPCRSGLTRPDGRDPLPEATVGLAFPVGEGDGEPHLKSESGCVDETDSEP